MSKESMKLALEALYMMIVPRSFQAQVRKEIYETIEAELAKQEQDEPVGVANVGDANNWYFLPLVPRSQLPEGTKLYTKPQQRKPLTDKQIDEIPFDLFVPDQEGMSTSEALRKFARDIESAHGIKE